MSIQSVPRQIPENLDLETNRRISNQLGKWVYGEVVGAPEQKITSGTSATINDNVALVVVDLASVAATFTLKMPESPVDGDIVNVLFGGTIDAGDDVVTALTVSANTGQSVYGTAVTNPVTGGTALAYRYIGSSKTWFRIN